MKTIVPEIDEIVNFYSPEVAEEIARESEFVQRESKPGEIEFLGIMTRGLYSRPDATLDQMVAMGKDINKELEKQYCMAGPWHSLRRDSQSTNS